MLLLVFFGEFISSIFYYLYNPKKSVILQCYVDQRLSLQRKILKLLTRNLRASNTATHFFVDAALRKLNLMIFFSKMLNNCKGFKIIRLRLSNAVVRNRIHFHRKYKVNLKNEIFLLANYFTTHIYTDYTYIVN